MSAPQAMIECHLSALVGFDTQNPPRALTGAAPLFDYLVDALPGFEIGIEDLGAGCVNFYARRGAPATLFNVHLDTVPATDEWRQGPLDLRISGDRCIGLGACDIKGAAAALLALAAKTDAPMAVLFTTDEEAGQGRCVRSFLDASPDFMRVIVAEPTSARAVCAHRGIVSGEVAFSGTAAHASTPLVEKKNAIHDAAIWMNAALQLAGDNAYGDDFRLNLGVVRGGVKPNMSAPDCEIRFGLRPPPGVTPQAGFAMFAQAGVIRPTTSAMAFSGPALPCGDAQAADGLRARAENWIAAYGLTLGAPVDFWTEASLFSAAGYDAIVLGPGDIAQAHTADEWVSRASLLAAYEAYGKILHHDA